MREWILKLSCAFLYISPLSNLLAQEVSVFFNHGTGENYGYQEPYRHIQRDGDDFESKILETITRAQKEIQMAVQEISLPRIAKALVQKAADGVVIKVIIENEYDYQFSQMGPKDISSLPEHTRGRYQDWLLMADTNGDGQVAPEEAKASDALYLLRSNGIKVINDTAGGTKGSALMHHKFIIIDKTHLLVTSANFSHSDIYGDFGRPETRGNPNSLIMFDHAPELALAFDQEFSIMWGQKGIAPRFSTKKPYRPIREIQLGKYGKVKVSFSPTIGGKKGLAGQELINHSLQNANQSIDFLLFVFSEQQFADRMREAKQRGVHIRGLVEPDFAWRWYSELLDLLGLEMVGPNCRYEDLNYPWSSPIQSVGTPQLPEGDRLHHKLAVIDSKQVLVGSYNWSKAAETNNDEFLLLIESPFIAQKFQQEIARRFQKAYWGIPSWLPGKIEKAMETCQSGSQGQETQNPDEEADEEPREFSPNKEI